MSYEFMDQTLIAQLGPLGPLAGIWEGAHGEDIALNTSRGPATSRYFERMTFDPFGPINNHEQMLYGLKYATVARRLQEKDPYHEELGYWLWDPVDKWVMRCFIIPRGITVLAGGKAEPNASVIKMSAEVGSPTFGISSNPFLDEHFKTVRYELTVTFNKNGTMSYDEDTHLQIKGQEEIFHHRDGNILTKKNS